MRTRSCVGPVVLDEIRRDYTAIDEIIRTHTHTSFLSRMCGADVTAELKVVHRALQRDEVAVRVSQTACRETDHH